MFGKNACLYRGILPGCVIRAKEMEEETNRKFRRNESIHNGLTCTYGSVPLTISDGDSDDEDEVTPKYPLWGSCRLVFTVCAFLTCTNLILMRFNMSFAMVCMTKTNSTNMLNSTNNSVTVDGECRSTGSGSAHNYDEVGEFLWSKELQGRILSGFFYGYSLTQGFGGWVCDKFGGKKFFILGNFLQSVCTLFIPLSARIHPELLFAIRILQGMVTGLTLPSIYQLYTRWAAPSERTKLMSAAYTGFPLANIIIFPVAGWLCQSGIDGGWPMIFYVTGTFGTICSLSFIMLVYDSPNAHPRISHEERKYLNSCTVQDQKEPLHVPWKKILTSKAFLAYNVAHFCQNWGFITFGVNLPTLMKEMLYFNIGSNGILSSLPYIGAFITRLSISQFFWPIQKRTGLSLTKLRKINHCLGTLLPAILILTVTLLPCTQKYLAVALIAITATIADLGFTGSYLLSYLDLAPQFAGLLSGMSNMIGQLPGVITPTLIGYITHNRTREEWKVVLYIMAGMWCAGGAFYILFGSSELQSWAKTEKDLKKDEKATKHIANEFDKDTKKALLKKKESEMILKEKESV